MTFPETICSCVTFTGFKPESKIKSGWTALIYAAHSGFPEIVDILIEFGSNANFQKGVSVFVDSILLLFEVYPTVAQFLGKWR